MDPLIVFCNFPDAASASTAAEAVVAAQLAACVNILPESSSVYRWEGKVVREREVPVLIKTTSDRYTALEARLRELNPAQVPEIIAVPVWSGLPAYLQWLAGSTRPVEKP
ncbi:MAG: divalent-cation tolerance protein CutA [Verrucomicrobiaceae bacterium]|nr:MAG: divalent-cation tolerance protein CutA [Verrucomicrobiaceae bacterium]